MAMISTTCWRSARRHLPSHSHRVVQVLPLQPFLPSLRWTSLRWILCPNNKNSNDITWLIWITYSRMIVDGDRKNRWCITVPSVSNGQKIQTAKTNSPCCTGPIYSGKLSRSFFFSSINLATWKFKVFILTSNSIFPVIEFPQHHFLTDLIHSVRSQLISVVVYYLFK